MTPLTLDDAATLLLQLDSGDRQDLARLRDALTELVFANQVPIAAQPHVARAARLLGPIVEGSAKDSTADLAEVSKALETAMAVADGAKVGRQILDAQGSADTPRPIAAPAAAAADTVDEADEDAVMAALLADDDPLPEMPAADAAAPAMSASTAVSDAFDPTLDRLADDVDRDLLRDFIAESGDCLIAAEAALLALEANPADEEAINTVFRAFHTVKGTSAFLGLGRVSNFAHEAESLLSRVRDKEIAYSRGCAELSLRASDMLKALLASVETGAAGDGRFAIPAGYAQLIDAIATYDPARDASGVSLAAAPVAAEPAETARKAARPDAEATIRVRTDRLDRLVDMIGELVIAQSMIGGDPTLADGQRHELQRKVVHAGKIVRELQDLSMSMRMIELRPTFQKLARVVRDTAVKAGKQVVLSTTGDETEIDRTLVDLLGDPLVHMVRNAVDHGIEPPDERERVGKPRAGSVQLRAYYASGNVVVELVDDGRGLHRDKIVAKAIEKGLIETDKGMSDSEVFNLIFAPGFSTAEKVTDISGRGVGMDVVRRNLEAIRGRIDITSVPGQGTTFAIRLPLTLAVTDGMLVRVGAERFIVPVTHIHLSFRPEPSMLSTVVGKGEVVLLRGELMPIVRLHQLFDVPDGVQSPLDGLLMVVGDGQRRTALLVDELLGQQQVVAKSIGDGLGKVSGVSGGAILGDGRVGLIVDVGELVALAQGHEAAPGRPADRLRAAQAA